MVRPRLTCLCRNASVRTFIFPFFSSGHRYRIGRWTDGRTISTSKSTNPHSKSTSQTDTQLLPASSTLPDLPTGAPTDDVVASIFGPHVTAKQGYYFLKALQFRRTSGSLIERGIEFPLYPQLTTEAAERALEWIRTKFPVDEEAAATIWISDQIEKAERAEQEDVTATLTRRAEKLRIYKPISNPVGLAEEVESAGRHGRELSVLDAIRAENERRYQKQLKAEQAEREKLIEEARSQGKDMVEFEKQLDAKKSFWDGVVAKTPEQIAKKEAELRDGMVSDEQKPPEMSRAARLGPTAAFTVVILVVCAAISQMPTLIESTTTDPERSPPSRAPVIALIAANTAIFIAWKRPNLWRLLNSHAILVAGRPRLLSLTLSSFSHTELWHFTTNMLVLWAVGTRLQDQIITNCPSDPTVTSAALLIPLYVAAGTAGSFGTLVQLVITNRLTMTSLGASGAVWAFVAAYLASTPNGKVGYSVDLPSVGVNRHWDIPAVPLLGVLVLVDQLLAFVPGMAMVGRSAHLTGAIVGLAASRLIHSSEAEQPHDG